MYFVPAVTDPYPVDKYPKWTLAAKKICRANAKAARPRKIHCTQLPPLKYSAGGNPIHSYLHTDTYVPSPLGSMTQGIISWLYYPTPLKIPCGKEAVNFGGMCCIANRSLLLYAELLRCLRIRKFFVLPNSKFMTGRGRVRKGRRLCIPMCLLIAKAHQLRRSDTSRLMPCLFVVSWQGKYVQYMYIWPVSQLDP